MKNVIKIFCIIALTAIIGFTMMACGDDEDEDVPTLAIPSAYLNTVWTYKFGGDSGPTLTFTSSTTEFSNDYGTFTLKSTITPKEGYDVAFSAIRDRVVSSTIHFKKDGSALLYDNYEYKKKN